MRDDLTGAVKIVGAAVKFCHAWIIDIHVVSVHNSQSCCKCEVLMTGDGRICCAQQLSVFQNHIEK